MKTFYTNESELRKRTNELNTALPILMAIQAEMNRLGLPLPENILEWQLLISSADKYLETKIISSIEDPSIKILGSRLQLSRAKLYSLIELPDLTELKRLCLLVRDANIEMFIFRKGKIEIDQKRLSELKDQLSFIARSERELQMVDALENFKMALEKFNATALKNRCTIIDKYSLGNIFNHIDGGTVTITENYLKQFWNGLQKQNEQR
jgi:hypothetical protein